MTKLPTVELVVFTRGNLFLRTWEFIIKEKGLFKNEKKITGYNKSHTHRKKTILPGRKRLVYTEIYRKHSK